MSTILVQFPTSAALKATISRDRLIRGCTLREILVYVVISDNVVVVVVVVVAVSSPCVQRRVNIVTQ